MTPLEMENTEPKPLNEKPKETTDTHLDDTVDVLYPSVTEEILSIVW